MEDIFEIKGDIGRKKAFLLGCKKNIKIFKEYEEKCSDWKKIHSLYYKIAEENTTLREAITYFIEICKEFINSIGAKKMPLSEGGFVEKLFDDFPFLYGTPDVYDLLDNELYGIAELFGHLKDEEDFQNLKKEFAEFIKKYGF